MEGMLSTNNNYYNITTNRATKRANNLKKQHKYPIGTLVELQDGVRVFVARHSRDCDGSPLYGFKIDIDATNAYDFICGYGESYITKVIGIKRK